ncbi:MAG TPA: helix-turn-helix transcriptional regulator [Streptosporangiaceae bacterium]|jgi:MerR family transcriptional regulator/heat shock protein HspR
MVNAGWADPDRGLFSISVAAELAGLHPQTLRIYEREGLLDPERSAGGTRRYSRRDIDRLNEICALTGEGLNMAGIRRVLELQEETRMLHAELARLRGAARRQPLDHAAGLAPAQKGVSTNDAISRRRTRPGPTVAGAAPADRPAPG